MKTQFVFQKSSEYNKQPEYDEEGNHIKQDVPMFKGVMDFNGIIYEADLFITVGNYGREIVTLCLETENNTAPF